MNDGQISCFLAVAETLNFARAAEMLNITQPAVTHQIRSLEGELGVKLFRRTTRLVELTAEGWLFLEDARQLQTISRRARLRFEYPSEQEVRTFPIGCHSPAQLLLLPDVLRALAQQHPGLHPQLRVVPFQHLYRLLAEGEVEAILSFREPEEQKAPGRYRELCRMRQVCLCTPSSPLAERDSVTLDDLSQERLVVYDPLRVPPMSGLQAQLIGQRPLPELYLCESVEAGLILVEAGFGVSLLPEPLVPPGSGLICLPVEGTEPLSFGIYYQSVEDNPVLRDFVRLIRAQFAKKGGIS